jgi:hypothetical protein
MLENLQPEQLAALADNPACFCREEAVARLRAMRSPLAKRFDPPVQICTMFTPHEQSKPATPPDTTEAMSVLEKMPVDKLLDIVTASSVYPHNIRLQAARMVRMKSPLTRYVRGQHANISAASAANTPTAKTTEIMATNAIGSFSNQFDRKVAVRMENPEFARMMEEAAHE